MGVVQKMRMIVCVWCGVCNVRCVVCACVHGVSCVRYAWGVCQMWRGVCVM